jgi:hypothetical protein
MSPSFKCPDSDREARSALAKCEGLLSDAELERVWGGGGPSTGGYGSGGGSGSGGGLRPQMIWYR